MQMNSKFHGEDPTTWSDGMQQSLEEEEDKDLKNLSYLHKSGILDKTWKDDKGDSLQA